MTRLPFYEIAQDAYLYPSKVKESGARKKLEEPVRQWCAHELIRAYGIAVASLEFERPVRMGSRPHWIDILISRGGKPSVVVECKKAAHRNADVGIDQAISYADAPEIQAEFVVYTNGKDWLVKRRIKGTWCAVPDLPREIDRQGAMPITDLLYGLRTLAPLLYKLDQDLAGEDARRFISALEQFFYGSHLLTWDIDEDLLAATDNLLRVLAMADEHPNYRRGKLTAALRHFEAYRKRKRMTVEIFPGQEAISHELQHLHASLLQILETAGEATEPELCLLRVDAALSEYGMRQGRQDGLFPKIGPSLHQTLHEFLARATILHLNASIPDHLDDILIGDMQEYCREVWDKMMAAEGNGSCAESLRAWGMYLLNRLRFTK